MKQPGNLVKDRKVLIWVLNQNIEKRQTLAAEETQRHSFLGLFFLAPWRKDSTWPGCCVCCLLFFSVGVFGLKPFNVDFHFGNQTKNESSSNMTKGQQKTVQKTRKKYTIFTPHETPYASHWKTIHSPPKPKTNSKLHSNSARQKPL